ncbi:glyoxalase superfamily protein [Paracoccus aestuariivivens]|uniref:Glyoxalase-related protein domain-containing protein n=1 Tax=Paracoccus aestuariivivens TaxID=1820333 RepID=A0A6L6J8U6_9RHOB|nr:glyoxalase superfamily protein [Paracoccus aestuariivivens]MTH78420.1 hypothetical protein [Paracoccus aestuariivivens]
MSDRHATQHRNNPAIDEAKAQAKALRIALQAQGHTVNHAAALELVARQHGARDWNTLHSRLGQRNDPPAPNCGERVKGAYLGQIFTGTVVAVSGPLSHRQIEIRLDEPVDTVRFESFSNKRHQIRGTIDETGRSPRKTSDGVPHLVVERLAT